MSVIKEKCFLALVHSEKIIEVPKKESNLKVSQILVPVTTFMAGAAIGKYGNILFKYFKTAA